MSTPEPRFEPTFEPDPLFRDRPASTGPPPHRVILASAGAGKTYRLTGRYLELLLSGVDPSTVLATTFTRKAAGEILAKTIDRLSNAIADADERSRLAEHLPDEVKRTVTADRCRHAMAELGRRLDRLSVSTLDGFFARLIGAFRYELGLPLEPRYLDDESAEAKELRGRAIEALFAEEAARDETLGTLVALMKQLHHDGAKRSVTEAIDGIVSELYEVYRAAPSEAAWSRLAVPEGVLQQEQLEAAVAVLAGGRPALPERKNYVKSWENDVAQAEAGDWQGFLKGGIPAKLAAGEAKYDKIEIPIEVERLYRPLVSHAESVRLAELAYQTRATHALLARFDARFAEARRQRGVMRFADATHALARELFTLDPGVLSDAFFRLDARVQHLLLDEFQDTSLEQWRVLEPFAAEAASQDRSFFCVGDPKQAIYGWRGGEVELFDRAMRLPGLGDDARQTLAVSWRSSQVVLDAVNGVFDTLESNPVLDACPGVASAWSARFEPHAAAKPNLPGHVTLETTRPEPDAQDHRNDDDGDDDEDDAAADALTEHERAAAEFIVDLHRRRPDRGIGVLVRKNAAASRLLYELRRRELPVSGEGGVPITDTPAVNAMLSALTLADHPGHRAAAFHVVNSPLGESLGLTTRDPRDVERFARSVRDRLLQVGYAATLAEWTRRVQDHCGDRSRRRLEKLIDLAEAFDRGSADLRPARLVAHAEALRIEEPATSLVRVMTIHKSKGLEFDAVVLPELDSGFKFEPTVLLDRGGDPTGEIEAVYRAGNKDTRCLCPTLEALAGDAKHRELSEWLCLLYVAMTRAKRSLHMLVKPLKRSDKGKLNTSGWSNLSWSAVLRRSLIDEGGPIGEGERETLYEIGEAPPGDGTSATSDVAAADGGVLPAGLGLSPGAARRGRVSVSPSAAGREARTADELLTPDTLGEGARTSGSVWHALFECVGFLDEQPPERGALAEAARRADPSLDDAAAAGVIEDFEAVLQKTEVRDALARRGASRLERERPFAIFDERGRLVQGRFDRLVIHDDAGGRPTSARVIDFKTDRIDEAGVADRAAHHRPQLRAYRSAAAKRLGVPVDAVSAELVFTRVGRVVAVR